MEKDNKFIARVADLVKKAQSSYYTTTKAMKEDKEHLKKMYEEFSSFYDKFTRENKEDIETLETVILQSAAKIGDHPEAYHLLESLENCFDFSKPWMDLAIESSRQLLNQAQKISNCYWKTKREEALKVRKMVSDYNQCSSKLSHKADTFMGIVTAITDPGEFYVVRWLDIKERDQFFEQIQIIAPTCCPVTDLIVPGQMYIAFNSSDQTWCRAIAGTSSSFFQVGDDPAETLYQCFLVDIGRHERISKGGIRTLPDELKKRPPYAIHCTSNANFKRQTWSLESTTNFKYWTSSPDPIEIKVLAKQGEVLNVDLLIDHAYEIDEKTKLPEHRYILQWPAVKRSAESQPKALQPDQVGSPIITKEVVSNVADSEIKRTTAAVINNLQKVSSSIPVTFVGCQSPESIYFRTEELSNQFLSLQNALYSHFEAHKESVEEPVSLKVGFIGAVKYQGRWYRAKVVNMDKYPDEIRVSLIDKGIPLIVSCISEIRRLPEELMKIPKMVLRCSLIGIQPSSVPGWSSKVTQYLIDRFNEADKIAIRCRKDSTQGHAFPVTFFTSGKRHFSNKIPGDISTMETINFEEELVSLGLAVKFINTTNLIKKTWKSPRLPNKVGVSFWATVTNFTRKGGIHLLDLRSKRKLDYIRNYLTDKFKDTKPTTNDLNCVPGDLCIAKCNSNWYRGVVEEINGSKVTVYWADYGTLKVVDIDNIRRDIVLEDVPIQVLCCSLYNLKPVGRANEWSTEEQKAILHEATNTSEFRVVFNGLGVGSPGTLQVTLVNKIGHLSFNEELVEKKLAEFVKVKGK